MLEKQASRVSEADSKNWAVRDVVVPPYIALMAQLATADIWGGDPFPIQPLLQGVTEDQGISTLIFSPLHGAEVAIDTNGHVEPITTGRTWVSVTRADQPEKLKELMQYIPHAIRDRVRNSDTGMYSSPIYFDGNRYNFLVDPVAYKNIGGKTWVNDAFPSSEVVPGGSFRIVSQMEVAANHPSVHVLTSSLRYDPKLDADGYLRRREKQDGMPHKSYTQVAEYKPLSKLVSEGEYVFKMIYVPPPNEAIAIFIITGPSLNTKKSYRYSLNSKKIIEI